MSQTPTWSRRQLIKALSMCAPAAAWPSLLSGCREDASAQAQLDALLAQTGPALDRRLPLTLFDASDQERELALRVISGRLPADLQGHVFIVAALPWGNGAMIFNGDGMMYRLDLGVMGGARLTTRQAKTPCYWADVATRSSPMGFHNVGVTRMSGTLGVRNELNTAWLPFGERLLVTYDGGRPWEVDVQTLELIAPMGTNAQWRSSIPFVQGPFKPHLSTAHPFFDEHTGQVFSVNYGPAFPDSPAFTDVLRWDGQGDLQRWTLVDERDEPVHITQSAHQLAVTQDYVILVDCAFLVENEQLFNANYARAQAPDAVVYLVRRDALRDDQTQAPCRRVVIPREIVHLTADYDNPQGRVTLYVAHNNATDASEWIRPDDVLYPSGQPVRPQLVGHITSCTDLTSVGRHVIDAERGLLLESKHAKDDELTWAVGFLTHAGQTPAGRLEHIFFNAVGMTSESMTQRIVDLYRDHPHREIPIDKLPEHRPGTLFHFDPTRAALVDAYVFPAGRFASSPQFVPRPQARHGADGYVVCTVVSDDDSWPGSSGDELWVFDAQRLAQGPLARLGHPELDLGFTLHTCFMHELKPRRSAYAVDVRQDYALALQDQPEAIKTLFEQDVFPRFDPR